MSKTRLIAITDEQAELIWDVSSDRHPETRQALREIAKSYEGGITEGQAYDATNPDLAHSGTGKFCQERIRAAFPRTAE